MCKLPVYCSLFTVHYKVRTTKHIIQELLDVLTHQLVVNYLSILSDKYKHNAQIGKAGHY